MCHGYKSIALCNMSPKGLLCRTYLQTAFAFSKLNPDRLFLLFCFGTFCMAMLPVAVCRLPVTSKEPLATTIVTF